MREDIYLTEQIGGRQAQRAGSEDLVEFLGLELPNEKFDRVRSGLNQIQERWESKLLATRSGYSDGYLGGHYGFILEIRPTIWPEADHRRLAVAFHNDFAGSAIKGAVPIGSFYSKARCVGHHRGHDQQIVLIPVIEGAEVREPGVIWGGVGLYLLDEQSFDFWKFPVYRRLSNGTYEALPIDLDWKRDPLFGGWIDCPEHTHPAIVQGGAEVVNGVSGEETEIGRQRALEANYEEIVAGLRILVDTRSIRLLAKKTVVESFELLDVFLGPFDL